LHVPEIDRPQAEGQRVAFRPTPPSQGRIYETLEDTR
jgi:hypothetical protein